jgi:putative DNA primase/helicase
VAAAIARVLGPPAPVVRQGAITALPPSAENATDAQTIARLAALSTLDYDRCREAEAARLGVRVSALDKAVAGARQSDTEPTVNFVEIVPWPDPVDPATLLRELSDAVSRFIVCRTETAHAAALWAAMTWFMDVVQVAPLAVITAPEKRCGKTQLLAVLNKLVYRPLPASSISSAGLFPTIDGWRPTLLIDEAAAFVRDNEELRGLLNCGHTRDSAFVVRLVGDDFTPRKFTVWGAKALAGIGHLADTVMDRAVTLELRRKLPHEPVARLRHAAPDLFDNLVAKLARFAVDYREAIRQARPLLPDALNDRAQDNWEPLLAIADTAGGPWPEWGRAAALALSGDDAATSSMGSELLADIRELFEQMGCHRIKTADLIAALCKDEEMPWGTYNRGKAISPRQVATRLKGYGIHSKTIRLGAQTPKGYERAQFDEAFARYLSLPPPPESSRHAPQLNAGAACGVADPNAVAATPAASATPPPSWDGMCCGVADYRGDGRWSRVEVEI